MTSDGIPRITGGTMTLHPEPDGSVSFRVLIAVRGGQARDSEMLKLIIAASYTGRLSIVPAGHAPMRDVCSKAAPVRESSAGLGAQVL